MKVRIRPRSEPGGAVIELDGVDISSAVSEAQLVLEVDDVPHLFLRCPILDLDVELEAKVRRVLEELPETEDFRIRLADRVQALEEAQEAREDLNAERQERGIS